MANQGHKIIVQSHIKEDSEAADIIRRADCLDICRMMMMMLITIIIIMPHHQACLYTELIQPQLVWNRLVAHRGSTYGTVITSLATFSTQTCMTTACEHMMHRSTTATKVARRTAYLYLCFFNQLLRVQKCQPL